MSRCIPTDHKFEAGDWVATWLMGFSGAYDPSGRILLDNDIVHHVNAIYSSTDELNLVREIEVYEAEREIAHEQQTLKHHNEQAKWHREQADAARKRLAEAHKVKRLAAKTPIKQPPELAR